MSNELKKEDLDIILHDLRSIKSALKLCQDLAAKLPQSPSDIDKFLRLAGEKMDRHIERIQGIREQ